MLVRFDSDVGGFTMFGEPAVRLLRMMGHSGTVPSAIGAEDVPAALERLRGAVSALPADQDADADEEGEAPVGLRRRALPLVEVLERAAQAGCGVHWDRG